ncbi:MAG: hypothetical protein EXS35_17380 [Pedosphaera sp.]|nr:hypothetical protein [Pedosphaera sp.]
MKRTILVLPVLIAGLGLILTGLVTAQTFTILHSFSTSFGPSSPNGDGASPYAGLVLSGNTLYGVARWGGSFGKGTVFSLNTDGTCFTNLHNFSGGTDGAYPLGTLLLSGNTLYGTTQSGGSSGTGTIFRVSTDGTGFTNLHSFTGSDGGNPYAGVTLLGNTIYGTTTSGGQYGGGVVFGVNTDGTGFTNLHSFLPVDGLWSPNDGGAAPYAALILSGNTLFGSTKQGGNNSGSSGLGTVFMINTDGTGFTTLHNFTGGTEGVNPYGKLVLNDNFVYGTTFSGTYGSPAGYGSVFKLSLDGTVMTNLHSFYTNTDGANLIAGLTLSGTTLYGSAYVGGSLDVGTVFKINTDGTGFSRLHTFTDYPSDGANPEATMVFSGNDFYGTTQYGGSWASGTVFKLSLPRPQLTIFRSAGNFILSWPSNVAGFSFAGYSLQSAPASTGTFTNLPGATSPYTNPITGAQRFFRLISN